MKKICTTTHANSALEAFYSVEAITSEGLIVFGERDILPYTANLPSSVFDGHVDTYRNIIRGRKWPNEIRPTSVDTFIREYRAAAQLYVKVGFEAYSFLAGRSELSLDQIFERVEASEALRGQFGKRAPHGIDARIERLANSVFDGLASVFGDSDAERFLIDIGTPYVPLVTAEMQWLTDTIDYLEGRDVLRVDALPDQIDPDFWTILGHYHWSVAEVLKHLAELNVKDLRAQRDRIDHQQRKQMTARASVINKVSAAADSNSAQKTLRDADALVALNFLNLRLEPGHSFKGPLGLSHLLIFETGFAAGLEVGSDGPNIVRNKWALFHEANPELRGD